MRTLQYYSITVLFCFSLSFGGSILQAQERAITVDTLTVRSGLADTTRRVSGLDTLVVYNAKDSISYSLRTRHMNLYGKSDIKYRTIDLKAERIGVNWDTATLTAEGVPDTSDKTGKKYVGEPVLMDGGEKYDGFKIGYNFQSKRGKISLAETEIEEGYYHGEEIKKVGPDVLFVEDGRYTTCSNEHPHFYFYSPKMKVIPREVVIAEPVYFYIADVPVFALPFGVFPNKSGRRSGLIAPAYGEDARLGRYFSHFGYYWAISDYLDFASTFDWYARGGWGNRSLLRYALRYNFSGSVSASVNRRSQGEPGDPDRTESRDYNIQIGHNQTIDPTTNLNVNFTFTSGSFYRNFSSNLNEILRQNIVSNATLTKTWTESNRSLSVFVLRDQSLVNGDIEENIPQISFNQGSIFPFRQKSKGAGSDQAWYETIGFNYSAGLGNSRSKRSRVLDVIKTGDSSLSSITEFQRTSQQSINQNVSLSFSPRLGNFTVSPSLSFSDSRTFTEDRSPQVNPADSSLVFQTTRPKTRAGTMNAGVGLSTRFFGIMQPNIFGITAFRHTVNPGISFGYSKRIYGTTVGPSSMFATLNVQNLFEMKYQPSDTAKEQKIQLMNIGANVSYNFRAPEFRVSELSVSYRTDIGQYLNISGSTTYNFYLFDRTLGRRVNKFLTNEKGYLADLTNVSLNLSTSLSGERKGEPQQGQQAQRQDQPDGLVTQQQHEITQGYYQEQEPDFSIPWNLSLNLSFSQSQADPRQKFRSVSLQGQLSFNLTEQWKISASGNYDLVQKQFAAPMVNVSRDLHCWIMNFAWVPLGPYRYYRLEIRVKAPALQDIKITKQGSERGVYY